MIEIYIYSNFSLALFQFIVDVCKFRIVQVFIEIFVKLIFYAIIKNLEDTANLASDIK
jgi:hypothetical protein